MLNTYDTAVILNQQSLDKFESKVKPGGTLIYDPYSIHPCAYPHRHQHLSGRSYGSDIRAFIKQAYNMVLLGSLLKVRGLLPVEAVMKGLKKTLPERHHHLLPINKQAILRAWNLSESRDICLRSFPLPDSSAPSDRKSIIKRKSQPPHAADHGCGG